MNTPRSMCFIGHSWGGFTRHFLPALRSFSGADLSFIAIEEIEFQIQLKQAGRIWRILLKLKALNSRLKRFSERIYWKIYCYQHRINFHLLQAREVHILKQLLKEKDFILSAGIRSKFSAAVLEAAPKGVINFHYGRLPQYRGTHPLFWQKMNNENSLFYCFHFMNEQIDAGDIIFQKNLNIPREKTIAEASSLLTAHASYQLPQVYSSMQLRIRQDEAAANTYTNSNYVDAISFDQFDALDRFAKTLNATKFIIFRSRYWIELSAIAPSKHPEGMYRQGFQLKIIRNGQALLLKRINYLPAMLYYWQIKKELEQ